MEGLREKVIAIAEAAGEIMLTEQDVHVDTKGTKENYVTSTDLKIQKFLRNELTALLPGSGFMGEEEDIPSDGDTDPDRLMWVVDPIDGTANYVRGIPMSVVSIALVKDRVPILGVVRHPRLNETFSAAEGKGAFLNGTPIHVSERTREHCMVCTAWSCYNKSRAALCFDVSQTLYDICEDIRRIGTAAYELCLLAKGSCDLYFEAFLSPWDYSAAACILKEAGGTIITSSGGLDCTRPSPILAANRTDNLDFLKGVVREAVTRHPEANIDIAF